MEPSQDDKLWQIARKRASFKKSLFTYLVLNAFFWGIWWVSTGRYTGFHHQPWPIWVMLGWGVGLAFQYFDAYNGNKQDLTEEEYRKLKKNQQQ